MKSHELVERINNGEIKDGTKINRLRKGEIETVFIYDGKCLKYNNLKNVAGSDVFIEKDELVEFEIVEERKGWFKPKKGEEYFYTTYLGTILSKNWNGNEIDNYLHKYHNCFRTKEEAQECLYYKNALKEAEKPFEVNRDNYYIVFDVEDNELGLDWNSYTKVQGVIFLGADMDVARAFIDKWKKQILKYEFDVWE